MLQKVKQAGVAVGTTLTKVMAPVAILVIGFLSGFALDKGPAPPTIGEIRTVVGGATNAVRTDLKMIDAKLVSSKPAPVVVADVKVDTVKTVAVSPPPKKKAAAKSTSTWGIFSYFKN